MRQKAHAKRTGFTLLEAVLAVALWMILTTGILFLWNTTTRTTIGIVSGQDAFENARASLDALLINLQLAETINLEVDNEHVLRRLTLTQQGPDGQPHNYIFYFNRHARPGDAKYHRLEFGLNNEFASQIASVKIQRPHRNRMSVSITTDGELAPALTFTGSADIRYKNVIITQRP